LERVEDRYIRDLYLSSKSRTAFKKEISTSFLFYTRFFAHCLLTGWLLVAAGLVSENQVAAQEKKYVIIGTFWPQL